MGECRAGVDQGEGPDVLANRWMLLNHLLDEAEGALAPSAASDASTFLGAFTSLWREGLEALLIVVAMMHNCQWKSHMLRLFADVWVVLWCCPLLLLLQLSLMCFDVDTGVVCWCRR